MKTYLSAAVAALALATLAPAAQAAPALGSLKSAIGQDVSAVEKTHGFHRVCAAGPRGWHRHTRWGARVWCAPPRPHRPWRPMKRRWH